MSDKIQLLKCTLQVKLNLMEIYALCIFKSMKSVILNSRMRKQHVTVDFTDVKKLMWEYYKIFYPTQF